MIRRLVHRKIAANVLAMFAVLTAATGILAVQASDTTAKPRINTLGLRGVAIKGYDPVAYFTKGAPTRGSKQFSLKHAGAEWRFSSAQNKAAFAANPARYKPAYGGYCAYGVAQGYLVKFEPHAWSIKRGRLYLNYSRSVQRTWSRKPGSYIAKANKKWPRLIAR